MPLYQVTNKIMKETYQVEAPFAQDACERLGWMIDACSVELFKDSPFSSLSASPRPVVADHEESNAKAALKRIAMLAAEWDANRLGGIALQRKRWQRLGEIARDALRGQ